MVDKELKYDRQLRLWASTGQTNLEQAHICMVNATTTGSEILKNLILPGIGKFTVVDDQFVDENDLSSNFFLKQCDLNTSRASAVTRNLRELNPDVHGYAVTKAVSELASDFWDVFNVVIISEYTANTSGIVDVLWKKQIPVLLVHTFGMYGSINLISHEITVVETHDPLRLYDLRIDQPWPELRAYVDLVDLELLDTYEHAHVPSIVIFIKALDLWKEKYATEAPSNYKEKEAFRKLITSMLRDIMTEANFAEAVSSSHRAFQKTQVPHSIMSLFENPKIDDIDGTNMFWIYLSALRNFIKHHGGQVPLLGNLPDMTSHTENYLALKKIYMEKAARDRRHFTEEVVEILHSLGQGSVAINEESITTFCKNAQALFVTQGTKKLFSQKLVEELYGGEKHELLAVYFAILTYNKYIDRTGVRPTIGELDEFTRLFSEYTGVAAIPEQFVKVSKELLLHDSNAYHNLNSLMGGICSQEVLKLTTGQYTPLDNVFVFDGVHSDSHKWKI